MTIRDRVLSLGEGVKLNPPRFGTFLVRKLIHVQKMISRCGITS
jgi:hypothetical protein